MKAAFLFIALLFVSIWAPAHNTEKVMDCHFNKVPFSEFCNEVYRETGVRVFYQKKWVSDLRVNLYVDSVTAKQAVTLAIKNTGLKVSKWNNNLVLLPHKKLLTGLPSYQHEAAPAGTTQETTKDLTASEERYLTGRRPDVIHTLKIGHEGGSLTNGKATILGRVLDEETGEPVNFATCYIQETKNGAVSGRNGFFTLLLRPGKYNATFNYMGYEHKKYLLNIMSDGSFTVKLRKTIFQIQEFVVHGDRQMNIKEKDPGIDKISMRSIKELPMMMGERDILKVSGTLPGIVSTGEGSAGLNVRGGGSDQNAFYIDKVPIYNTSHLFGFFPAFNSDIIKDFAVYKGYIPAQYGGRLSSVFNIMTRQGNLKRFTAHGGISPVAGNLEVEGPIKKDALSFLVSARSTYSDWILKKIKDPTIKASAANFYDYSGSLSYNAEKTQMSLFYYHSFDHFRLSTINDYNYSNDGASLDISHNFTNSLRGDFTLIESQYTFSTVDKEQLSSAYQQAYKMGHYEARADFTKTISNYNTLKFGGGVVLLKLDRGNVIPYGTRSLLIPVALGREKGIETSLYASDSYNPIPILSIKAGLRFTMFSPLGPSTVYYYTPGMPRDLRYVSDTVTYGNDVPIHWYSEPDIRASVNFQTDENGSIKLAFNQMHQNLFMLNNTIAVSPNVQWKLADYHIHPSKSNQISFGVFRSMPKSGLEASVEVYYKQEFGNPEFKDGASFLDSPNVETVVLQGKEKGYGVEVLVKRTNRKLEGWLTYTYSRSLMTVNGGESWNSINNGETYPSNFDIPHVANLVLDYHLNRRVTFSTIMTYRSGKPITYPVSVYYVDGQPHLDYSKRNAYRIPDYFRMDLSLAIEGNLKRNKPMHSSFVLSVYNLTGRQNPYSVYFNTSNGRITGYSYSVIGVPIFTITWNFKLGNYASE